MSTPLWWHVSSMLCLPTPTHTPKLEIHFAGLDDWGIHGGIFKPGMLGLKLRSTVNDISDKFGLSGLYTVLAGAE